MSFPVTINGNTYTAEQFTNYGHLVYFPLIVADVATVAQQVETSLGEARTAGGFSYDWDTGTTAADPGSGKVRVNNATIGSATAIYISETDLDARDISAVLASWDDGTSTIKGTVKLTKQSDMTVYHVFSLTGTITDNGTYDTLSVTYVGGNGSFSSGDDVTVTFIAKGDKGDTGATGADGDVTGPVSSVNGNLPSWNGTGGNVLQDSGIAAANVLVDADIGSSVQAYDADTLKADTADVLTAGFAATPYNAGTKSSGTYTPNEANGNFQYATNGGAHTLAPPTNNCTIIIQYTNNGSAGAITTSGFTAVDGAFTTTNGDDFMCYITKLNGFSHLNIKALQ